MKTTKTRVSLYENNMSFSEPVKRGVPRNSDGLNRTCNMRFSEPQRGVPRNSGGSNRTCNTSFSEPAKKEIRSPLNDGSNRTSNTRFSEPVETGARSNNHLRGGSNRLRLMPSLYKIALTALLLATTACAFEEGAMIQINNPDWEKPVDHPGTVYHGQTGKLIKKGDDGNWIFKPKDAMVRKKRSWAFFAGRKQTKGMYSVPESCLKLISKIDAGNDRLRPGHPEIGQCVKYNDGSKVSRGVVQNINYSSMMYTGAAVSYNTRDVLIFSGDKPGTVKRNINPNYLTIIKPVTALGFAEGQKAIITKEKRHTEFNGMECEVLKYDKTNELLNGYVLLKLKQDDKAKWEKECSSGKYSVPVWNLKRLMFGFIKHESVMLTNFNENRERCNGMKGKIISNGGEYGQEYSGLLAVELVSKAEEEEYYHLTGKYNPIFLNKDQLEHDYEPYKKGQKVKLVNYTYKKTERQRKDKLNGMVGKLEHKIYDMKDGKEVFYYGVDMTEEKNQAWQMLDCYGNGRLYILEENLEENKSDSREFRNPLTNDSNENESLVESDPETDDQKQDYEGDGNVTSTDTRSNSGISGSTGNVSENGPPDTPWAEKGVSYAEFGMNNSPKRSLSRQSSGQSNASTTSVVVIRRRLAARHRYLARRRHARQRDFARRRLIARR